MTCQNVKFIVFVEPLEKIVIPEINSRRQRQISDWEFREGRRLQASEVKGGIF
jgi:hypothetical protein